MQRASSSGQDAKEEVLTSEGASSQKCSKLAISGGFLSCAPGASLWVWNGAPVEPNVECASLPQLTFDPNSILVRAHHVLCCG